MHQRSSAVGLLFLAALREIFCLRDLCALLCLIDAK
jgi:hypothetical protein